VARTQRIRRKDLRQPDEFVTLSRRAIAYAEENRTTVFLVAGAIVLVLAAVLVYRGLRASRENAASDAYVAAHALLDQKKYGEAATAFQAVADGYGSTRYASLAQLEAANALLLAGERSNDAAIAYKKFLDGGPPTDYLRQLALVRLGHAQEQSRQPQEASASYASAAELAGPFAEDALLGEARAAEAAGDSARAQTLYQQFLGKYPASDQRALVSARIVALGGIPKPPDASASASAPEAAE
jgi:predicted negative regulator of RcsB-dependent stress response